MSKRPLSITIISWLFIGAGSVGLLYHATEFKTRGPFQYGVLWICIVRLLAIVGGVFMLQGHNWARWLLVAWLAYHVALSAFHTLFGVLIHSLLLAVIAGFLLRPHASAWFRGARKSAGPPT